MTDSSPVEWVENRPSLGRGHLDLRELWRFRELVWYLAVRDVQVRYKQAFFGALWAILQPLAGAAAFTLVFRKLVGVETGAVPYLVFVYVGFLAWTYLTQTITTAVDSLVSNVSLVTKIYFPRIAAPLSALLPALVDVAVGAVVLAVLLVALGPMPPLAIVTAPVWLFAFLLLALGLGLFLSRLQVSYRDTRPAASLAVQLWLFISPVAYPATLVPGRWRALYALNPAVGFLGALRWSVLGTPWPGWQLASAAIVTAGILAGGLRFFLRGEEQLADVI